MIQIKRKPEQMGINLRGKGNIKVDPHAAKQAHPKMKDLRTKLKQKRQLFAE